MSEIHTSRRPGETRVNQSGSVALDAEVARGPPQRNRLITAFLAGLPGYEPTVVSSNSARGCSVRDPLCCLSGFPLESNKHHGPRMRVRRGPRALVTRAIRGTHYSSR